MLRLRLYVSRNELLPNSEVDGRIHSKIHSTEQFCNLERCNQGATSFVDSPQFLQHPAESRLQLFPRASQSNRGARPLALRSCQLLPGGTPSEPQSGSRELLCVKSSRSQLSSPDPSGKQGQIKQKPRKHKDVLQKMQAARDMCEANRNGWRRTPQQQRKLSANDRSAKQQRRPKPSGHQLKHVRRRQHHPRHRMAPIQDVTCLRMHLAAR